MIFGMSDLLEDPAFVSELEERVGPIGWALVATDDAFEPTDTTIDGLHGSVLETDPIGREMRPKPKS